MTHPTLHQRQPARRTATLVAALLACALGASTGLLQAQTNPVSPAAGGPVIYPAKGQNPQQQDKDKYECYDWARGQTGFDPIQMAQGAPARPATPSTPSANGMVVGALGGAAVAELTDHSAGRGAATGAMGMAMIERAKQKQSAQAQDQQATQQQMVRKQQLATYGRAFSACLEARGYVVK